MDRFKRHDECYKIIADYDRAQEHMKWLKEIPFIKFPDGWEIKMSPPFHGAIVRFRVKKSETVDVSIYLDCYDYIGSFGEPYWEVYRYDGDVGRCKMNDTGKLIEMIQCSLSDSKVVEND